MWELPNGHCNRIFHLFLGFFQEFDPAACRINIKGEFYYHPKLKDARAEVTAEPTTPMKITEHQVN